MRAPVALGLADDLPPDGRLDGRSDLEPPPSAAGRSPAAARASRRSRRAGRAGPGRSGVAGRERRPGSARRARPPPSARSARPQVARLRLDGPARGPVVVDEGDVRGAPRTAPRCPARRCRRTGRAPRRPSTAPRLPRALKVASRTRSGVGRVRSPSGATSLRPRADPGDDSHRRRRYRVRHPADADDLAGRRAWWCGSTSRTCATPSTARPPQRLHDEFLAFDADDDAQGGGAHRRRAGLLRRRQPARPARGCATAGRSARPGCSSPSR